MWVQEAAAPGLGASRVWPPSRALHPVHSTPPRRGQHAARRTPGCAPSCRAPPLTRCTPAPAPHAPAEGITLPFKAVALINEHGRTRLDVTVKARVSARRVPSVLAC